ncbi:hypothetical protein EMCRGX_G033070 [Ephydatia muelleri]
MSECHLERIMLNGCAASEAAETRKPLSNGPKCQEVGWSCIPLAVETFGNWGEEEEAPETITTRPQHQQDGTEGRGDVTAPPHPARMSRICGHAAPQRIRKSSQKKVRTGTCPQRARTGGDPVSAHRPQHPIEEHVSTHRGRRRRIIIRNEPRSGPQKKTTKGAKRFPRGPSRLTTRTQTPPEQTININPLVAAIINQCRNRSPLQKKAATVHERSKCGCSTGPGDCMNPLLRPVRTSCS